MSLLAFILLTQGGDKPMASVKLDAKAVTVGQPLKGTLYLTLPEGQHGYQNPPADEFENPITLSVTDAGFKLSKVDYPKGMELKMDGAEKPTKVYEGTIQIPFTLVTTKALTKATPFNVTFKVDYQLCTMSSCYPPATLTLKSPLTVNPAKKVVAPKKAAKKP